MNTTASRTDIIIQSLQRAEELLLRSDPESLKEADRIVNDCLLKYTESHKSSEDLYVRILSLQNDIDMEQRDDYIRVVNNALEIFRTVSPTHKAVILSENCRCLYLPDGNTLYLLIYESDRRKLIACQFGIRLEDGEEAMEALNGYLDSCSRMIALYSLDSLDHYLDDVVIRKIIERNNDPDSIILSVFDETLQLPSFLLPIEKRNRSLKHTLLNWVYSRPMRTLLDLYGYQGDPYDYRQINEFVDQAFDFRHNRERYEITDSEFEITNRHIIARAVTELGIPGSDQQLEEDLRIMKNQKYDYAVIFGAMSSVNHGRALISERIMSMHPETTLLALSAERLLTQKEQEIYPDKRLVTEFDNMAYEVQMAFELPEKDLSDERVSFDGRPEIMNTMYREISWNDNIRVISIPSSDPSRRTTSWDQISWLFSSLDLNSKKVIIISGSRYRFYTLLLLYRKMLQCDCHTDIYFTGQSGSITPTQRMAAYLQEVKGAVNMITDYLETNEII